MTVAARRVLAGFIISSTILAACAPAIARDELAASPRPSESAVPVITTPIARSAATARHRPSQTPAPTPTPVPQPFALNLYQEGDFVPQYTFDWCVAASIQIAHNLVEGGAANWTARDQQGDLWEMARARSFNAYNGANPLGWAEVLTSVGLGPYAVVSVAEYDDALRTAARAIADTGRPVGLVMWRGRHAWVMSGFEALGDPARFADFTVTGIRVQDPLYPHGSGQWGPSPEPNSLLTPEQLAAQFVVRTPRRWSGDLPTGYLLVLPLAEA